MRSWKRLGAALLCLASATSAAAQHQHEHGAAPRRLGKVEFATTCTADVSAEFNRAVALLHSFWFGAANDAFAAIGGKDSGCAMAWWGVAMSQWGNPFGSYRSADNLARGRAAVGRANAAAARVSAREQAYIAAVAALFKDYETVDQRTRTLAYEQAMSQVAASWPEDREASLFYALAIDQTALLSDKTYQNQMKAAGILEKIALEQPDHPGVAHYLIHTYDAPALAARGLDAARRYARIAPDAPHALHMPSHTFTRVGLWQESIDTNLASAQAAHREGSSVEELHALDYQAYAYLQTGQDRAVARIMTGLDALAAKVPDARPDAAPIPAGYYALAAIPARYALERGDWKAAAALSVRSTSFPWTSAITHFARALGAARSGQPAAARADIARLAELQKALADKKEQYWAQQVEIQMRGAEAWALSAEGRHDEAIAAMRAAADLEDTTEKAAVTPGPLAPARELLAEMLLEQGRAADALVEFEQAGKKEPNRFRGLAGSAAAAQRAGDRAKAAAYAKQLVALCAKADRPERPGLRKARELAKTSE